METTDDVIARMETDFCHSVAAPPMRSDYRPSPGEHHIFLRDGEGESIAHAFTGTPAGWEVSDVTAIYS